MSEKEQIPMTLTDRQRRLVRDNVGLVAVHLSRNVVNDGHPKWRREWDELFQEGCLGLIRAATAFRAGTGIPFAAFALPRIRNAVSRAMLTRFNAIYVPPKRTPRRVPRAPDDDAPSMGVRRDGEAREPKVLRLSGDLPDRAACRHHPVEPSSAHLPTVGGRLREKYERAVHKAARAVSNRASRRGDRGRLVHALVEERLLVPEESFRRPLRCIGRDTRSSCGRVDDCVKQLQVEIRRTLEADAEFSALQMLARTDPFGVELRIDEDLESRLAGLTAAEFGRRFVVAPREERTAAARERLLRGR